MSKNNTTAVKKPMDSATIKRVYGKSKGMVLVYIRGLKGPEPQVWEKDVVDVFSFRYGKPITSHELNETEKLMPISELVQIYPTPELPTGE